jgi:hypothetical protein
MENEGIKKQSLKDNKSLMVKKRYSGDLDGVFSGQFKLQLCSFGYCDNERRNLVHLEDS